MLNMLHGTHYQVQSPDDMPVGKIWGPWLWYLVKMLKLRVHS
jgi:rhamnogalacturonan endolyase